jgi:hypothetical protein
LPNYTPASLQEKAARQLSNIAMILFALRPQRKILFNANPDLAKVS